MNEVEAKKNMKCLLLMFIAIAFITLDISINIGNIYPGYQMADGVRDAGWEFQLYTMNLHYGAYTDEFYNPLTGMMVVTGIHYSGFRIDVLSDFVGYILAFIAMKHMVAMNVIMVKKYPEKKKSPKIAKLEKGRPRMFQIGMITTVMAAVLDIVKLIIPFFFNGMLLCYMVFVIGIAAFMARMLISYCFVSGVCAILRGIQFRQDRRAIYIGWFVSMVCSVVVAITTWTLLERLTVTYNIVVLFATVFYLYRIFILRDYIAGYRPVAMEDVAKDLEKELTSPDVLMEEYHYASRQNRDGDGENIKSDVD